MHGDKEGGAIEPEMPMWYVQKYGCVSRYMTRGTVFGAQPILCWLSTLCSHGKTWKPEQNPC